MFYLFVNFIFDIQVYTEHDSVIVEWAVYDLDYFEVAVENAFFANVHMLLFYVVPHTTTSY